MKKLMLLMIVLGSFACKKKEDEAKEETVVPVTPAPARANEMSASVNGAAWSVKDNKTAAASIQMGLANSSPKQYSFIGRTDAQLNKNSIYGGFTYTTGVVNLEAFTDFWATYVDSTGTGYPAKTGTFNISLLDTSHAKSPNVDKLKMSFSFVTVTLLGVTYTITNGQIDYEAK